MSIDVIIPSLFISMAIGAIGLLSAIACFFAGDKVAYRLFQISLPAAGIPFGLLYMGAMMLTSYNANAFTNLVTAAAGMPCWTGILAAMGLRNHLTRWIGRVLVFLISPLSSILFLSELTSVSAWTVAYLAIQSGLWLAFEKSYRRYKSSPPADSQETMIKGTP